MTDHRMTEEANRLARMGEVHSAKALSTRLDALRIQDQEQARAAAEAREAQSAAGCVRRLEAQIRLFESELDADQMWAFAS